MLLIFTGSVSEINTFVYNIHSLQPKGYFHATYSAEIARRMEFLNMSGSTLSHRATYSMEVALCLQAVTVMD